MIFILYFLENFPRRRILHRHNNECFLNLFGWTKKSSSQQLNYLTCTFEPKYNWAHQYFYSSKARAKEDHCVQKNGVSARSLLKFQLDDRAKGSDMKHWKMLFEAFSSTHITSHTLTKSLNNVQVYYYHQSSIRKGGIFRKHFSIIFPIFGYLPDRTQISQFFTIT